MKNKVLFMSAILAVVLMFGAAFASFAEMSIQTSSKINTDGSYTLVASVTEDEGEVFYQWYRCNSSGSTISPVAGANSSTFHADADEENTYYLCRVNYLTEEGEKSLDSSVFTVEAKVEEKSIEIMTFAVDGIDKPITNMTPDSTAIATGSSAPGYTIASVEWEPRTSYFQAETAYTVTVTVKLNEGYEAGNGYTCTIDGETAVSSGNASSDTISFYYTFPATEADTPSEIDVEEEESSSSLGAGGIILLLVILAVIAAIAALIIKTIKSRKTGGSRSKNRFDEEDAYTAKIREAEEAEQDLNELKRIRALDRENIQKNSSGYPSEGAVYGAEMNEQEAVHRRKSRETVEDPMDVNGTNAQPETTGYKGGNVSQSSNHNMPGSKYRTTKETIIMSKDAMGKRTSADTINMQKSDINKEPLNDEKRRKKNSEDAANGSDISYFDDSEIDNRYF